MNKIEIDRGHWGKYKLCADGKYCAIGFMMRQYGFLSDEDMEEQTGVSAFPDTVRRLYDAMPQHIKDLHSLADFEFDISRIYSISDNTNVASEASEARFLEGANKRMNRYGYEFEIVDW